MIDVFEGRADAFHLVTRGCQELCKSDPRSRRDSDETTE